MAFSSFSSGIETLHPFYSLLGEAAATLLGLLFVSVTFNPKILEAPLRQFHRNAAESIFRQFVFLVWLSLIPERFCLPRVVSQNRKPGDHRPSVEEDPGAEATRLAFRMEKPMLK